ncbi:MAG: N-acetylmuramoyl-L-alanine amidase [Clostridia bacterium]|nr:N-acetylmuramoyl-L-alanine amidase [Clostridia bacterium]
MKRILLWTLIACIAFCALSEADRGSVVVEEENTEENKALPLAGYKIGIDPGHQAKGNSQREPIAPGSRETKAKVATGTKGVSTGIPEHVTDLQISLKLRDLLALLGAEVLMTRETADVDISNVERAVMMNEWGADAVLRIHCDGSTDHTHHGIAMYVRKTGTKAEESALLGRCLLSAMTERTGAAKKSVYKRDTYTGLNWSEVPCVLAECGYMSNPEEDEKLNDPAYQDLLVLGMAEGLIAYFEALNGAGTAEE